MSGVVGILLAAGRGTRFGADKLQADLTGSPLAHHAARTLAQLPLARCLAVIPDGAVPPPGCDPVHASGPEAGQGRSLALGVLAASDAGAEAVLVALADMPCVSVDHLRQLLARRHGPRTLVASSDGTKRLPPALFGRAWFARLAALDGDVGGRGLLAEAEVVAGPAHMFMDVDRPADLMELRRRLARDPGGSCS